MTGAVAITGIPHRKHDLASYQQRSRNQNRGHRKPLQSKVLMSAPVIIRVSDTSAKAVRRAVRPWGCRCRKIPSATTAPTDNPTYRVAAEV